MKYAYNDNGILRDVVMSDPYLLFPAGYAEQFIEVTDESQNGWLWDGETASEPPPLPPAPPEPVTSITPRQARLALLGAGLLEQIQAAFAELPEPDKTAASIEWEYASSIERSSPLVSQMAAVAGLTDEQVDELFAAGAAL